MTSRTYYRGPDAVVTDQLFLWQTVPARGFDIRQLHKVCLARTPWGFARRRWEVLAVYRGREVVVYASHDTRVFNQVVRALRRALEDARPPQLPPEFDLAG